MAYHQKRDQLFDAAVIALVEMGNCQNQRHLNQKQANTIEAFLAFDGGDRTQLCEVPRLIIIGVMEPLTRLKNCAQRNSITGNTVMGDRFNSIAHY